MFLIPSSQPQPPTQHLWGSWNLCHCQGLFTSPGWTDASSLCWLFLLLPFSCTQYTPKGTTATFWVGRNWLRFFGFLWMAFQLPQLLTKRCTPCIFIITIEKFIHYIRVSEARFCFCWQDHPFFPFGFHYAILSKIFYTFMYFKANLLWSPIRLEHFWYSYDTT